LEAFASAVERHYGGRLHSILVYGSRARGEARGESDTDVAVVLRDDKLDRFAEIRWLADLAFDVSLEHGVDIEAVPISYAAWQRPSAHTNPGFIAAIKRDGLPLAGRA
jgi:predicted nucleotidyltransferase